MNKLLLGVATRLHLVAKPLRHVTAVPVVIAVTEMLLRLRYAGQRNVLIRNRKFKKLINQAHTYLAFAILHVIKPRSPFLAQ
jgi:hypothetical protein